MRPASSTVGGVDFDERAGSWDDDEARAARTRVVAEEMRAALGARTYHRGMDFGAGTGSLSLLLADRFDEVVLVDTSRGMLDVAAGKVAAAGSALTAKVTGLAVDLTEPGTAASSGLAPVDVVYSLMAMHHVPDAEGLLGAFRDLLAPDGLVLLADLEAEDGSYHAAEHDFDGHHGFERAELARALGAAGLTVLSHRTVTVMRRTTDDGPRDYPVFLAVARRL